ncbi:MAG: 4Fe-4S binding protein [Candidatus Freyarchaeum deiterrae]
MIVVFDNERVRNAITSTVILEKKVALNIITANIDEKGGEMLIEAPDDKASELAEAFKEKGAKVETRKFVALTHKCMFCGDCLLVCPVDAIVFDDEHRIAINQDECIGCLRCVDKCPSGAIIKIG